MNESNKSSWCEVTPKDRANGQRVTRWSIAWAAAMLIASAVISNDWVGGKIVPTLAAGISTLLGIATVNAYRHFLRETDELRQKIEMEALAAALGVGIVGGMAYSQFTRSLDLGEPRLAIVVAAMLIAHSAGVVIGRRRYA